MIPSPLQTGTIQTVETVPLLSVRGLKTYFHTFGGVVKAVDGVDFDLASGEILGLVGESGGGKSMIGFSIMGLIDPPGRIEAGEVFFEKQDLLKLDEAGMREVRGKRVAMIFQDPMTALNPLYTVGNQLEEMLRLHTDLPRSARRARCVEMLREVGISQPEERLDNYPHQFSGGMRQRVVIAIAMIAGPRLLIADEPTTALDVTIQAQLLRLMKRQVEQTSAALILITHDLAAVSQMADKVVVVYCGRIVERGPTARLIGSPAHHYTRGLLDSIPHEDRSRRRLHQIPGSVPNIRMLPPGCAFAPRCPAAQPLCREVEPVLADFAPGHAAACHFPLEAKL
ncbi:MAG: dipeptide/oligopeptide/nickel ABC transporter ATP-binding protein [Stutzerimonas stutzeri]|nr:MAG: dipeptide/oligopeptide/nickel ABC transporter ATP-binding protein [Stutzerimonas stutzeri]